jgi:hypothetical protein
MEERFKSLDSKISALDSKLEERTKSLDSKIDERTKTLESARLSESFLSLFL